MSTWRVSVELSLWQDGRESIVPQFTRVFWTAAEAYDFANMLRRSHLTRVEVPQGVEESAGVYESGALVFVTDDAHLYDRLTIETRVRIEVLPAVADLKVGL